MVVVTHSKVRSPDMDTHLEDMEGMEEEDMAEGTHNRVGIINSNRNGELAEVWVLPVQQPSVWVEV